MSPPRHKSKVDEKAGPANASLSGYISPDPSSESSEGEDNSTPFNISSMTPVDSPRDSRDVTPSHSPPPGMSMDEFLIAQGILDPPSPPPTRQRRLRGSPPRGTSTMGSPPRGSTVRSPSRVTSSSRAIPRPSPPAAQGNGSPDSPPHEPPSWRVSVVDGVSVCTYIPSSRSYPSPPRSPTPPLDFAAQLKAQEFELALRSFAARANARPTYVPDDDTPNPIGSGAMADAMEADPPENARFGAMEQTEYPCLIILAKDVRDITFYLLYFASHPEQFPVPVKVEPDQRLKWVFIYYRDYNDFLKGYNAPFDASIGKVLDIASYDPFRPKPPYFRTYYGGSGIRDPAVREAIRQYFLREGIAVTEVVLSKNEELVAVYTPALRYLTALVLRNVANGFVMIPPPNGASLGTALAPKHEFAGTNDPSLFRLKLERIPSTCDPRMVDLVRDYAETYEPRINREDIVLLVPQKRKGSSANTPYGFLWVRGKLAFNFFLHRANLRVRNTRIIFKVPDPYIPKPNY